MMLPGLSRTFGVRMFSSSVPRPPISRIVGSMAMLALLTLTSGCGSTTSRTATEQLLSSDAVDMAVSQIDFRPLAGQQVYFDTNYLRNFKGIGFVNAEYIISSLRQQIVTAGCLLQDERDEADYIIEGRIGALGTDVHDIVYGLPASNTLSTAAAAINGAPPIPTIPEISFARKNDQKAAAKLAVFAYERESKQRVWQSGMAVARSSARDTWFLGAGPFQSGTVYDGVQFAGSHLDALGLPVGDDERDGQTALSDLRKPALFQLMPTPSKTSVAEQKPEDAGVVPAAGEASATDSE